ncbi:hypothetical protein JTB14_035354 [Gonioctena quinquepunctata]|nr:hypothetical protein JTB14_035354 [Gonioctena quinquepunctata]
MKDENQHVKDVAEAANCFKLPGNNSEDIVHGNTATPIENWKINNTNDVIGSQKIGSVFQLVLSFRKKKVPIANKQSDIPREEKIIKVFLPKCFAV